jgi:hypothetical protein
MFEVGSRREPSGWLPLQLCGSVVGPWRAWKSIESRVGRGLVALKLPFSADGIIEPAGVAANVNNDHRKSKWRKRISRTCSLQDGE